MKITKSFTVFFLFLFLFLFSFLILSCSSGTDNDNKVFFYGKVALEGQSDDSGVTVSFYRPVALDTNLVNINQQYPNIGIQVSQETEFDHREQTPVATIVTAASDGSWSLQMDKGVYNIVLEKDGYGWKYEYEKTHESQIVAVLYPVQEVSGIYLNDFTFNENRFYMLSGEVVFAGGTNLKIEKAIIAAEKNTGIRISGTLTTNIASGFAVFTNAIKDDSWNGIMLESDGQTLSNLIIKNADDGLQIKKNEVNVNNSYIKNTHNRGIVITSGIQHTDIQNVVINGARTGVDVSLSDNTNTVRKTIVYKANEQGINLNQAQMQVENTVFLFNATALQTSFDSNIQLSRSLFKNNLGYDIQINSSDPMILNNVFNSPAGKNIYISPLGNSRDSKPVIHDNNFNPANYFIIIAGNENNPNRYDLDATNNWWGTVNSLEIQNKILDKADLETTNPDYDYTGNILYAPYLSEINPDAGINN